MNNHDWLNHYEIVYMNELLSEEYINRKGKCRFCNGIEPIAQFKHISHVVPEFLGNKFLFSNDECDECNRKFGNTIENDLANFVGIHRTLTAIKGKNGIPSKEYQKEREKIYYNKDNILSIVAHANSEAISISLKEKTLRIESQKEPYYPIGVFKALTKIALSVMPENYLSDFSKNLNWLNESNEINTFLPPQVIRALYTFIPGFTPFPAIQTLLIKRKDGIFDMPYMIFRIAFKNFIYQIPLFRDINDLPHIGESHDKMIMHLIPNYHDYCGRKHLFGSSESIILDFSLCEKLKAQKEKFEFSFGEQLSLDTTGMAFNHRNEVTYAKLNPFRDA